MSEDEDMGSSLKQGPLFRVLFIRVPYWGPKKGTLI